MTEQNESVPLVTFALFAYNQEKYIREAVEAALAQDYPNLEIIISDDCSTDGTWAVIDECLDSYHGPHSVVRNRNQRNLGVISHLNLVASMASADYIVAAAGDDVSRSNRVSQCQQSFSLDPAVHAVFSDVTKVDTEGRVLVAKSAAWMQRKPVTLAALAQGAGGVGIGAAYAYRKKCFMWPWALPDGLVSEDKLLPLRAFLCGGVAYIPEPLVSYRVSGASLTDQLIATRQRPGSRPDHIAELARTLKHAFSSGLIAEKDCKESLATIHTLPMVNRIDAFTRTWPRSARSITMRLLVNLVQWRTAPARVARKFRSLAQRHES